MKLILLLSILFISLGANAQFFKKSPIPAKTYALIEGATSSPTVQNFIKPIVGVSASVSNGTALNGGIGVSFQHSTADQSTNSWVINYSISAIGFLGTTGNKLTGTAGLIFGIPGTGGLIQIGPGYDFTQKQVVLLTGVAISIF